MCGTRWFLALPGFTFTTAPSRPRPSTSCGRSVREDRAVRLFSFVALAFSAGARAGSFARSDRDHATPPSSSNDGTGPRSGRTWRSTTSTRLLALLAPRSWRHSADGNAVSHRDDGCGATASASAPRAMHEAIAPRRRERRPEVLHASRAARAASHDIGGTVGSVKVPRRCDAQMDGVLRDEFVDGCGRHAFARGLMTDCVCVRAV